MRRIVVSLALTLTLLSTVDAQIITAPAAGSAIDPTQSLVAKRTSDPKYPSIFDLNILSANSDASPSADQTATTTASVTVLSGTATSTISDSASATSGTSASVTSATGEGSGASGSEASAAATTSAPSDNTAVGQRGMLEREGVLGAAGVLAGLVALFA